MKLIEPRSQLLIICILSVSTIISIFYIDFDLLKVINTLYLSKIINTILNNMKFLESEYFLYFVVLIFFLLYLCLFGNGKITGVRWRFFVYLFFWFIFTLVIKNGLKIFFGRFVPSNFLYGICSDGCTNYGFNWFTDLPYYHGSFPSGHCVALTFCAVWLSCFINNFSFLVYLIPILIIPPLVIANYHFLSDCLAGILIGYLCGVFSVRAWIKQYN